MDEIEQVETAILDVVDNNGGRVEYRQVYDAITDSRQRQLLPKALQSLKAKGIAQKQNRLVEGKPVFEVFRIGAPVPTPTPAPSGGDA